MSSLCAGTVDTDILTEVRTGGGGELDTLLKDRAVRAQAHPYAVCAVHAAGKSCRGDTLQSAQFHAAYMLALEINIEGVLGVSVIC